jgi:hypothetical protein
MLYIASTQTGVDNFFYTCMVFIIVGGLLQMFVFVIE